MQLKLFTPGTRIQNSRLHKRKLNGLLSTKGHLPHWDLWTQQSESDREMALLFLDLRDFTPLTGLFQASDIVHLVKKLLTTFQRIVRIHHGRIIETTGDGFYAAFGFNQSIDDAVNEAVASGHAMLKYLEMMNIASFEKNLDRKIEAGIGIHAGKVATGRISLGGEEHLMVMGQAVNIASRLQSATKELNNNFVISSAAFGLLRNAHGDSVSANILLKGVKDMFSVRLIGKRYEFSKAEFESIENTPRAPLH
jgi:adenylate cyclase